MTLAKYCKSKGMTLQEYENFQANIINTTQTIANQTKYTHGMYFPVNDIITYSPMSDMRMFIIQELKKLGFEFIEEYTLYRY